ncbi:MAG: hypothetical protein OXD35_15760 [Thiotrichales bacterium]|nr:hypothetical protein [Thiotrichales bacterium]
MKRLMCKRLAGVAVTALALTLAGCGGSSNNKNESSTDSSGPSAELTSARSAYETADRRVGNLTDDSTDMEIRDAHNARVAAATALLAVETDSEEREKVAEAKGQSEALAKEASERISEAQDNEQDEMRKTANAASMQVAMAILGDSTTEAHSTAASDTPAEFGTGSGTGTGEPKAFAISRISGDTKFELGQSAAQAKAKPFKPEGGADAPTGAEWDDDWTGKTFTYTDPDGKEPMESGTVYTNIEMAKDQEWADFFNGDTLPSGVTQGTAFSASGDVNIASSDVMRITLSIIPPAPPEGVSSVTADKGLDSGSGANGMFYGVPGRFTCGGGTACTPSRNDEGMVTIAGGTLTFRPTIQNDEQLSDIKAKYAMVDGDYVHFGYWMDSDKQKDGIYEHEIRTFSGGVGTLAGTFSGIRGKAEYSGAAAGRYVKKSDFDVGGNAGVVEDGAFIADVNLTAQFGNNGGTVAVADQWSIKGKVSNFMDGSDNLGWTLMLDKADLAESRGEDGVAASPRGSQFSGETTGSAGARPGTWSGVMYGNAGSATTTGANPGADDHPLGVSGEFNGHFSNGHVAGAFGAEKD